MIPLDHEVYPKSPISLTSLSKKKANLQPHLIFLLSVLLLFAHRQDAAARSTPLLLAGCLEMAQTQTRNAKDKIRSSINYKGFIVKDLDRKAGLPRARDLGSGEALQLARLAETAVVG